jgi:hypothetical protein
MKKVACVFVVAVAVVCSALAQEAKKVEKSFIHELKTDKNAPAKKVEKSFINEQKTDKKAPAKK